MTRQNFPVGRSYINGYTNVEMVEACVVTVFEMAYVYWCEVSVRILNEFREVRGNKMSCGSVG